MEVPCPKVPAGRIFIRTHASLVSAGAGASAGGVQPREHAPEGAEPT
jgi:hypothetical protein